MRTKFLAFAATALMLASCSNDEVLTPQDDLKDTPISIASAGVAELTTRVITEGYLIDQVTSLYQLVYGLKVQQTSTMLTM